MKLNIALACIGLGFLAAALYRMGVVRIDRKFVIDILPLLAVMTVLIGVAYRLGGLQMTSAGVSHSMKMIAGFAPMMTVMFLMMGQATVIVKLYQPALTAYLAGRDGVFGSLIAAYLMPGGLTSMPIVRELWDKGVNPIPLVAFTMSSGLVNWQIALIRQPILGWKITAINFCLGTLVACAITGAGWLCMAV